MLLTPLHITKLSQQTSRDVHTNYDNEV